METLLQGEKLVFLYQLIQGTCDTSFACHVASLAGLPEDIVKRGSQVSHTHCHTYLINILGVGVYSKK